MDGSGNGRLTGVQWHQSACRWEGKRKRDLQPRAFRYPHLPETDALGNQPAGCPNVASNPDRKVPTAVELQSQGQCLTLGNVSFSEAT